MRTGLTRCVVKNSRQGELFGFVRVDRTGGFRGLGGGRKGAYGMDKLFVVVKRTDRSASGTRTVDDSSAACVRILHHRGDIGDVSIAGSIVLADITSIIIIVIIIVMIGIVIITAGIVYGGASS